MGNLEKSNLDWSNYFKIYISVIDWIKLMINRNFSFNFNLALLFTHFSCKSLTLLCMLFSSFHLLSLCISFFIIEFNFVCFLSSIVDLLVIFYASSVSSTSLLINLLFYCSLHLFTFILIFLFFSTYFLSFFLLFYTYRQSHFSIFSRFEGISYHFNIVFLHNGRSNV